jgi:hypothetical protein
MSTIKKINGIFVPNTFVTGFTYNNSNLLTVSQNGKPDLNVYLNQFSGLTINGIISATTYYGDGSNLTGLVTNDFYVTGGTFVGDTLTLDRQNGSVVITGFTFSSVDTYVTGFTYSDNNIVLSQNGGQLDLGINISVMTGLTINGNLSATSINTDYIDFNTNPTVPNPIGGTLYFDYNENALSYKPVTNQNDVTVNIGQESLIRIYNDTGTVIYNGQVLHITGATSGIPTVALANASKLGATFTDSLAQSSGVATHDIPNGEYGFMTNFGIVRDLNTSGFTVGQELFLSDTIDGAITSDPNNISYTSRISTIGWCLSSDPTSGKIFVKIENENPLQSLTQQEINVLLGNTISTGVYSYTGMTKASSTTVNVSPMRGWIVYNTYEYSTNPLVLNIYYSGGTNIPVTNINSSLDTYFLVNSGGTLYQQTTFPTPEERRQNIFLGRAVHPNKTDILNVEQTVDFDVSPLSCLRDLWVPIRLINQGVIPSDNGANLQFKTSSGTFWGNGIGWDTNELNPNAITVPAYSPAHFYYTTQTGGSFTVTANTIDTTNYDVGGVAVDVPGNGNYTTQRIYMSQSGVIRIQYGQNYYSTLAKAIAAIPSETFVENSDNGIDCILIGLLTVKDGATALNNIDDAIFTLVSKFGEILGGTAGISTTTLQQAYNNSVNPEIITNSTLNGVQFKGGTGNDTDNNIVIEDNGSNVTGYWQADGTLFAKTITGNSATIGVNLTVSGNTNTSSLTTHFATINNNLNVVGTTNVNTLSASSLTLYLQPNSGITNTEVLTRNSTTGNIEYQNISNFTYLTGGTYYEGDTIFRNNLNNTFTVLGTTTYSAGVLTGSTTWSPVLPLNGQINLPQLKVALYNNPNNIEPIRVYTISSGITGVDVDSLVNNQTNYIVIDYNGGSPIYRVLNNDGTVNDSSVILYLIVYRLNNFTHVLEFGNYGAGLPNKLNDRLIMTDRFGWESGLTLGLSGSTGIVTLSSGIAWNGSYRQNLISVNSQDDIFFKNYHSGGTWVYDTSGNTINNVYYDNGVNIVSGTTGKYLVNWYFRGQEINDHLYEVYGTSEYDDITIAEATGVPELPELITSHAFLVGRVIVGVNQTTGITQTAFSTVFQPSGAPGLHNNLTEIQGGTSGQYYHLNSNQYNNIALTNVDNNFSTSQRVNGNLSANTVTIVDLPTTNNNTTQLLTRNSTTGAVELTDSSSPNIFNYGLVFAISSGNYLQ